MAKEFEDAKAELEVAIVRVLEQIDAFPAILSAVQEKKRETAKLCKDFIADVAKYSKDIRPHGVFSAAKQKLLSVVGKSPYSPKQTEAIESLTKSVTGFLADLGICGEM